MNRDPCPHLDDGCPFGKATEAQKIAAILDKMEKNNRASHSIGSVLMVAVIVILLFIALDSEAAIAPASEAQFENESYYSNLLCTEMIRGRVEILDSGLRPDCITDGSVFEFDWAKRPKHYECLGQALIYGAETGKQPICALLARNDEEFEFGKAVLLRVYPRVYVVVFQIYKPGYPFIYPQVYRAGVMNKLPGPSIVGSVDS